MFLGQCEPPEVDQLMLILDVPTRWNSTFHVIKRPIAVRKGLKNWLCTNTEKGKVKLGSLQVIDEEWEALENICILLKKFESSTKIMSRGKYPTLSLVMLPKYRKFGVRLNLCISFIRDILFSVTAL